MTSREKALLSLTWLIKSIEATDGQGSSHIYSRWRYPLTGWHLGYPETTGYIIETLLDYHPLFPNLSLEQHAKNCGQWLLTQQLSSGAFPSLLADSKTPSIFNSGMIAFGLLRLEQIQEEKARKNALKRLSIWVHQSLAEGKYRHEPTYFLRAIWAFMLLADHQNDTNLKNLCREAALHFSSRFTAQNSFEKWGFSSKDRAYSHTIAYSLRGCFEIGRIDNDPTYIQMAIDSMHGLMNTYDDKKGIAGSYDSFWNGDFSYRCCTGNAQLSILASKLFQYTKDKYWLTMAQKLLDITSGDQIVKSIDSNLIGALPGSVPLWGPYMRFKYPNWAVKFYLDALIAYSQIKGPWETASGKIN